jgi:septum formation protein
LEKTLILASGSSTRAELLGAAGVPAEIDPPRIDEVEVKAALRAEEASPRDVADTLAEMKAVRVSHRHPGAYVVGADQVLALDGEILDKPRDLAEARRQLLRMRARRHTLLSAAVVARDGRPIWRHVGQARLAVRAFSDGFLDDYIARHGEALLDTVGAYRLEAGGVVLFDRIEGDHFTILGLPLLELLAFLRLHGVCRT